MLRFHRTLALLTLTACGGDKKPDEPPVPKGIGSAEKLAGEMAKNLEERVAKHKNRKPTGQARPQDKLEVTLDGKPLKMIAALARRDWDGGIKVEVSSVALGCGDLVGRSRFTDEITFNVRIDDVLQPDGAMKRELRQIAFDGMFSQKSGPADGDGDGSPDKPTTLVVDFETESMAMPSPGGSGKGEAKKRLVAKGTIEAIGCPAEKAPSGSPGLPAEMQATLEVAGQKRAIRGAFLSKTGDWPVLKLTTGAETCKDAAFRQAGDLGIDFIWFKPDKLGQITLGGRMIGQKMDQTFDPAKAKITPAPPVPGDVTLDVDVKISDYPVKLTGKVTAVQCPK